MQVGVSLTTSNIDVLLEAIEFLDGMRFQRRNITVQFARDVGRQGDISLAQVGVVLETANIYDNWEAMKLHKKILRSIC